MVKSDLTGTIKSAPALLKKGTALALAAALIALSPGSAAAASAAEAFRGAFARASAPAPIPLAAASAMPLGGAPIPASAPLLAAGAAASAPAAKVMAAAAVMTPAAPAPVKIAAPRWGGLTWLESTASSLFSGKSSPQTSGVAFDGSKEFAAENESVAAPSAPDAASPRLSGLSKSAPRGPPVVASVEPTPVRRYALVAGLALAPTAAALFAPGHAAAALSALSIPFYNFSNWMGMIFPGFQVYKIFKNRSAEVSSATLVTGIVGSLLLAVNFAHLGLGLAAMQNIVGVLGFGVIALQKYWYGKHPEQAASPNSSFQAATRTILSAEIVGILTKVLGHAMLTALPGVALAGTFLIPFQILAGLGFAYLMLPEYLKIKRDKDVGDTDHRMAWAYWASGVTSALWSVDQLIKLASSPATVSLAPLVAFATAVAASGFAVVRWIAGLRWGFVPSQLKIGRWTVSRETMINSGSFLLLAAFMLAGIAGGFPVFNHLLTISTAHSPEFKSYLFYVLENVISVVVTTEMLKAHRAHSAENAAPSR